MNHIDLLFVRKGCILLISLYLVYSAFFRKEPQVSARLIRNHYLVLGALAAVVILLRIPRLADVEMDVDTSTWIASALSIDYYPDKLWKLFNYTDSRPLTVAPLYLLLVAGIPLNYITSELLFALLFAVSLYFTYRSFLYFLPALHAFLLTGATALFLGSTDLAAFVPYNSEGISLLLLSMSVYGAVRLHYTRYTSRLLLVITGFLLGSLVYAKFQNVPMGLVITAFILYGIVLSGKWHMLIPFLLAGIAPTVLVNFYFFFNGKLDEFWIDYLLNYFEYSFTTKFQNTPLYERFYPRRVASFLFHEVQLRYFYAGMYLTLIAGIVLLLTRHTISGLKRLTIFWLSLGLVITSLYSVLQAGNMFGHYLLYLILPSLWGIAAAGSALSPRHSRLLAGSMVWWTVFQVTFNMFTSRPGPDEEAFAHDREIVEAIRSHSSSADNIVLWGWMDRFHYLSQRASGYRIPHTHQLFLDSKLLPRRIASFLGDLEENKPELFLEDITGKYATMPQLFKSVDRFPEIRAYLNENYTLLTTIQGIAIYKRNRQ